MIYNIMTIRFDGLNRISNIVRASEASREAAEVVKMMALRIENIGLGQPAMEATFFSRSSKSLRSAFDARLLLMRQISSSIRAAVSFKFKISSLDRSDFLASWETMPVRASTFSFRSFRPSPKTLNCPCRFSVSAPTSVTVNLPFFLACFFMFNIVIERDFSVKQKISEMTIRLDGLNRILVPASLRGAKRRSNPVMTMGMFKPPLRLESNILRAE